MPKEFVDTRKLKDSAAAFLKKGKLEKAADVLEQLARYEPKETSHQLRLGDAYRRIGNTPKAISAYRSAAKIYSDQDQLIRAIGAVKVILEIDPGNEMAQRELEAMNDRRFARPTLESVGLAPPKPAPGRAPSAIELPQTGPVIVPQFVHGGTQEAERPITERIRAPSRGAQRSGGNDRVPGEFAPEELDVGLVGAPGPTEAPASASTLIPSPPSVSALPPPPDFEATPPLDFEDAPPLDLESAAPPDSETATSMFADDDLVAPGPEDLVASPEDEAILGEPLADEHTANIPPGPAIPIAELLSTEGEEEIELFPVPADEGAPARPVEAAGEDFERAFGNLEAPHKVPVKVPLFDDLSQPAFVALVNQLSYRRFTAGRQILREGEPGRSFFVIVEGRVRIWKRLEDGKELVLAHLDEGAFFGEMALLSGAPRTANVSAEKDTELLEVTDSVLHNLAEEHPGVVASLRNFYRQRLLSNVMAMSPLFKGFDPVARRKLIEKFRLRQASAGEVLIAAGQPSDGLYVVLHGAVTVTAQAKGAAVELARLKEGDIFGEMSLLTHKPATATVTSPANALLLRLPRESFQELVVTHPQVLELVAELTEKRAAATRAALGGESIASFV